jgi:hypothetical protein
MRKNSKASVVPTIPISSTDTPSFSVKRIVLASASPGRSQFSGGGV